MRLVPKNYDNRHEIVFGYSLDRMFCLKSAIAMQILTGLPFHLHHFITSNKFYHASQLVIYMSQFSHRL